MHDLDNGSEFKISVGSKVFPETTLPLRNINTAHEHTTWPAWKSNSADLTTSSTKYQSFQVPEIRENRENREIRIDAIVHRKNTKKPDWKYFTKIAPACMLL